MLLFYRNLCTSLFTKTVHRYLPKLYIVRYRLQLEKFVLLLVQQVFFALEEYSFCIFVG